MTEREVSHAILRELDLTTRLVVAHRAATAARCDRVVWLEDGRVRAVAPHARLWQQPGYRAVFGDDSGQRAAPVRSGTGAPHAERGDPSPSQWQGERADG